MPWKDWSVTEQREEFVKLASAPGANKSEVCRRFAISREKGYKWLRRYSREGVGGLCDRSRRPKESPERTPKSTERAVLTIRAESNNAWGGRKIAKVLERKGRIHIPSPSTITEILRRHGKLHQNVAEHPGPFLRFEHEAPNDLWQMDFKGHFAMRRQRCHPLTVLDDHSRYSLGLEACSNEQDQTVRACLVVIFRRYGLPFKMLMDNGSPWGDARDNPYTIFTVWLMQLGIRVTHGRPYHPQTQGKDERFHRTLKAEVLANKTFADFSGVQKAFDKWRHRYNHERPHQALGMNVPASRYRASQRSFPEQLPEVIYDHADIVRKVDANGWICLRAQYWRISKAFRGKRVALRPAADDRVLSVNFGAHKIGMIDLRSNATCGFMDIARAMPTSPQVNHNNQKTIT